MEQHDLIQGSKEWHAHRANHFNASDAPAMLGVSPYKSRTELIKELATGIVPEVDELTQSRFDDGHRAEALARPLAEKIIGKKLYPVVGTDGKYSASFDGLTMDETIGFEHKKLNAELRRILTNGEPLPELYTSQMEQQHMVSGAEKTLFLASDWDAAGNLIEALHCWYVPDPAMRERIVAGWEQLEKDIASYVPTEIKEAPKAEAILQLPALTVQIRGEVVATNLPQFKEAAEQFIATIKTELETDEDFAQAEANVKFCKEAEDGLELAKKAAIAQTSSIDELMRTVDYIKDQLRQKRLVLDKAVKDQKEAIKSRIIADANHALRNHLDALYAETKPIEIVFQRPDFAGAIKGLKKLDSIHDAVNTELANAKISADQAARDIRNKLAWFNEYAKNYLFLFADLNQIIYKPEEDFDLLVESRIKAHKEELEAKAIEEAAEQQAIPAPAIQPTPVLDASAPAVAANEPVVDLQQAVVDSQDDIAAFMASREFGKDANKVRAALVEFVKFTAQRHLAKAA